MQRKLGAVIALTYLIHLNAHLYL